METIVFTGGVGEHAAPVREKICRGLEYLGLQFDGKRNAAHEAVISAEGSRVVVQVISTDEDLVMPATSSRHLDENGRLIEDLASHAPKGNRRMGANPHANGGTLLKPLNLPDYAKYAVPVDAPATERHESTRQFGKMLSDVFILNKAEANFRITCPDETNFNRLGDVFAVENRCFSGRTISVDDHVSAEGRVMEVLSEHLCEGWLEGYLLTGRHGLDVTYEAFAMVSASMTVQHTNGSKKRVVWSGARRSRP